MNSTNPANPANPARRTSKPRPSSGQNHAAASPSPRQLNRARHESRCIVCRHPDRESIEEEFLHWHSPFQIGRVYNLEQRSIYRHAHALNLFAVRRRNIRFALGHIIEEAERCSSVNAGDVVRAVHAFARINDRGQWIDPPTHLIVSSGTPTAAPHRPALEAPHQPALPPHQNPENPAENRAALSVNRGRTKHHAND
jgi:hypothetical protein